MLNYSGLLTDADTSHLDGLAQVGDRADKLTLTFSYGSTDPDIALTKVSGQDYTQIINSVRYISCPDAAVSPAPVSIKSSGCSFATAPSARDLFPTLLLVLAVGILRRRRS